MDLHTRRPAERRPTSARALVLVLVLALAGATAIASGCKGDDEKKPDEEPAVALKIPESGELPGADEAEGEDDATATKRPARTPGGVALKTSADRAADAATADTSNKPATVTARTSKRLQGKPPLGPAARKAASKAAGIRPAPPVKPATTDDGGDGEAAAGDAAADEEVAEVDAEAAEGDDPESEGDDDPRPTRERPEVEPRTSPEPTRIAGRAPPRGAAPVRKAAPAGPPLNVERFLPLKAVRELVSERRIMAVGPLAGLDPAPGYNSLYFAVPGTEGFGAAVQAWQDEDRRGSVERYRRMRRQYPNAEDVKLLAPTKAFYSSFGPIQTLTLTETSKFLVVSVSCGEETCSQQVLLELAKHVQQNL